MKPRVVQVVASYLLLLTLLAVEFAIAKAPFGEAARGLVLLPSAIMVGIVAAGFMELGKGPQTARFFAFAGVVWLAVLLGLGSLDPMSRVLYPTQTTLLRQDASSP